MHYASSFPGYHFARDLIPEATAIPWPPLNSDITWRSGTDYNGPLQQPSIDHYMGYGKEVMRHTMLNHEATFRYQVHELHRLYRRQKDLMNELQRRYTQLQTSQLDHTTSPIQPDISQKTFHVAGWPVINATGLDLSCLGVEKFQGPLAAVNNQQADANLYSSTKTTKFGKRILDLELPGDQYIDCEEEENTVEENVAEVPKKQCDPPKESSKIQTKSDSKLFSLRSTGSPSLSLNHGRNNCLIDLNEPAQLDESEIPIPSSHVESAIATCCKIESDRFIVNKSACNPSFGSVSSYPTFICDGDPSSEQDSPAKRFKNTDHVKSLENVELNFMPPRCSSETETPRKDRNAYGEYEMEYSVNALGWSSKSCFDGEAPGSPYHMTSCNYDGQFPAFAPVSSKPDLLEVNDIDDGQKEVKIESSLAHDPVSMLVKWSKGDPAVNSGIGSNFASFDSHIDLNTCINEDGPSPQSCQSHPHITIGTSREIDLEAPVSPENQECSPPRGESDDMQLEIPLQFVKEDERPIGGLDKVAAEAIISISSSGAQWCLEQVTKKPPEPFSDCLDWFAGVVSSMAENLEIEIAKILTAAAASDRDEFKSDESDYLKASKLKQTAKNFEDHCYKSNEHEEEETADNSLPRQRGRGRKGKQRKVVRKKAMHTLGVLSGATGASTNNVMRRKRRNMGENGFMKHRPDFNIAHGSVLEQFMHSPPTWNAKDKHIERCLRRWGSPKGRRKARRARSSFHDFPPFADFHLSFT